MRTVGLTIAVLGIVAFSILAWASLQPAPDGAAGQLPPAWGNSQVSMIQDVKEVNYYPAANGWAYMWTNFDPVVMDRDFARIHSLGANTVRVIIQPSVFGYPTVRPVMADRLSEVIALAAKHSLRVHLTLFDWWSRYTDIHGSKEWVSSLLARYRDDPRIAFVELHNEIKPQNHEAVAWVAAMLPYLSAVMPGTLRTVSVANMSPELFVLFTHELQNSPPDFWDYHYYGPAWDAYSWLSRIKALAAPRPLFIGETGYSTGGTTGDQSALEQAQAAYYRVVFTAAAALGLPNPAPWILNDFSPVAIPPGQTADNPSQYGYGLYRVDGTPKPAAAVVREAFTGELIDSIDGNFQHESLASGKTVAGTWQVSDRSQGQFAISHSVAYQSDTSVEISDSASGSPGHFAFMYAVPVQPVHPGTIWAATVWAQGTGTSGLARVALQWLDSSGHYLEQAASASLPAGDSTWTQLTVSSTAPGNAAAVLVLLETKDDLGTAWFDGVTAGPVTGSR